MVQHLGQVAPVISLAAIGTDAYSVTAAAHLLAFYPLHLTGEGAQRHIPF